MNIDNKNKVLTQNNQEGTLMSPDPFLAVGWGL